jgi:ParB-like chromosome segregation protein Spo0J
MVAVDLLKPLGNETRKHPPGQIRKLAHSMSTFGLVLPVVIDREYRAIAGWAVVQAARRLELQQVPCIAVTGLNEAQLRALRLALNRLAEDSRWDKAGIKAEFSEILSVDATFDLTDTAFEMAEIDELMLEDSDDWADLLPPVPADPVSQPGGLWLLGDTTSAWISDQKLWV